MVLASRSASRAAILRGAGVAFDAIDSGVDEDAHKTDLLARGAKPRAIAEGLAEAKALSGSARRRDALVIGADQTLDLEGALFDKAPDLQAAARRLRALRGKAHRLHSAVVVAKAGAVIWRTVESPRLKMRDFSDAFLEGYLARCGDALLGSVGCYLLEGEGAQLFSEIEGDYFAVLGLPLLPLLDVLRREGALAS
ncbi:MAG TPA: Maf family protein [Caulobacteraceae bacterium]|nr:Maf family protein [Caulobacteraceae bacterium]